MSKRILEFDGVRGVAVLLVMLFHVANPALPGGWVGVDIFFVLSGFLITSLLIAEHETKGAISVKAFYARRALRLLPAVMFLLAAYAVFLSLLGFSLKPTANAFWATQFYVVNWILAFRLPIDIGPFYHFWSLSTEEQFYLLWPAALIVLLRSRNKGGISRILCVVIALIHIWRLTLLLSGASSARLGYGLDARADMLLIGCLLALKGTQRWRVPGWSAAGCAIGVGLIAAGSQTPGFAYYSELLVAVLIAVALLGLLQASPEGFVRRALQSPPLAWTGRISYGLYLWHVPVQHHFYKQHWPWPVAAARVMALSFLAATFSYYVIERPFLRLKGKLAASGEVNSKDGSAELAIPNGVAAVGAVWRIKWR